MEHDAVRQASSGRSPLLHRTLSANPRGRDFFVSDLHGQHALLMKELAKVAFDEGRDRLISVGDLVDRGPDSAACLDLVTRPWMFAVRGNHEQMMLDFLALDGDERGRYGDYWCDYNGGAWFCELAARDREAAAALGRLAAGLPLALTVETAQARIGVVHAGVPAGIDHWGDLARRCAEPASADDRSDLVWNRDRVLRGLDAPVAGIDVVVSGHTPVPEPLVLGNSLFIDTGAAYPGGRLTLLAADEVVRLVSGT